MMIFFCPTNNKEIFGLVNCTCFVVILIGNATVTCLFQQQVSTSEQKVLVVSVSPQSRASLAAHYSLTSNEVGRRLTSFLKNLGW